MNFKKYLAVGSMALMMVALAGCPKPKPTTTDDKQNADAQTAPQIDNQPMNFDPAGSDGGKIDGLQTVHFDYDKAALREDTRKQIQKNADWMKAHANVNVQIEGHCDNRGSIEYNLALGERRARSVKDYMTSLGIADSRLSIISYGKEKPIATGDSDSAAAKNRRANFLPLAQ